MDPLLGDWILEPTRIHSLNSMGHNWWTSCTCMGGLLALSLQNELEEARDAVKIINEVLPPNGLSLQEMCFIKSQRPLMRPVECMNV